MSLFIRELSLYKKVLTLSLRVWTSTTLSNSLSRGLSLFLRVQTLRYRVIESHRVLFFTVFDPQRPTVPIWKDLNRIKNKF